MKNRSVKVKITVWMTMLMAVLAAFLMALMMFLSDSIATGTAMEQMTRIVRGNLDWVEMREGKLHLEEGFVFYQNGVSTLVYSKNGSLLAGQVPVTFTTSEAFQNGTVRTIDNGGNPYMILDVWVPSDWESGVWVRGVMEAPDTQELTEYLLRIALIALPVFMLLAAIGSYRIVRKALRPLDTITATAEAINEAKDLSGRIGLPEGKDEFSRLASDFDHMFERLERSFNAEKQFTADASHELRTPIAIIKGACEYAEKYDETPEDHQETISMIHRQAERMNILVSQLLSMTRMEQGTEKAHMEEWQLGDLVQSICQEENWRGSRFHLEVRSNAVVKADYDLMGRLIRNLVENGFKYGKPDGNVWVEVTHLNDEGLVAVRDDGIGIPEGEQDKIWQRFYQVDASRSEEEGTGLGLAMVRQIARIHGGYMTLESTVDQGSKFVLHLPLKTEEK